MQNDTEIKALINHLSRDESGKMVSVLINLFGTENIELVEDVIQDAFLSALENWKIKGIPQNPGGWLHKAARNKAIDILRKKRHRMLIDFSDPQRQLLISEYTLATTLDEYWTEHRIKDDFIGMMFACCHPIISAENQITLILKILCGFSTKEIAKAFLTTEETITKRLYRTKEYFRSSGIRPQLPPPDKITTRINAVLSVIYLMFNEGYNSTHSDELIREDLIAQAILLCRALLEDERTQLPAVYALMSLMHFHAARQDGRLSSSGELILLAQQDRSKWNTKMIYLGNDYLNKAAFGNEISTYHYEAAIAYEHCVAKDYSSTNWQSILRYYDALLSKSFDPVTYLNRSIVILELYGPEIALDNLKPIREHKQILNYYIYHATPGIIHEKLGQRSKAITHYNKALQQTQSKPEKQFIRKKLERI